MINSICLVGRMTKDAELRYTPGNQAVATFTLAVNRNFKSQDGEREADFINCVIWRQQAENLANWFFNDMPCLYFSTVWCYNVASTSSLFCVVWFCIFCHVSPELS